MEQGGDAQNSNCIDAGEATHRRCRTAVFDLPLKTGGTVAGVAETDDRKVGPSAVVVTAANCGVSIDMKNSVVTPAAVSVPAARAGATDTTPRLSVPDGGSVLLTRGAVDAVHSGPDEAHREHFIVHEGGAGAVTIQRGGCGFPGRHEHGANSSVEGNNFPLAVRSRMASPTSTLPRHDHREASPNRASTAHSSPRFTKLSNTGCAGPLMSTSRILPNSPTRGRSSYFTAVPVKHLYRIPASFFSGGAYGSLASNLSPQLARHTPNDEGADTFPTSYLTAEHPAHALLGVSEEDSVVAKMEVLEEQVRRAAELYISGGAHGTESVASPPVNVTSGAPPLGSLLPGEVQVARGYRRTPRSGAPFGDSADGVHGWLHRVAVEKGTATESGVMLRYGAKRQRQPWLEEYFADLGGEPLTAGVAFSEGAHNSEGTSRARISPGVSSSSSVGFASPQSPALVLAGASSAPFRHGHEVCERSGQMIVVRSAASSPFDTLLAKFSTTPSLGSPRRASPLPTSESARLFASWVRRWQVRAFSLPLAAFLLRDTEATVGVGGDPESVWGSRAAAERVNPTVLPKTAYVHPEHVASQPSTLRAALLFLFKALVELETELAAVLCAERSDASGWGLRDTAQVRCSHKPLERRSSIPRTGERGGKPVAPTDGLLEKLRMIGRQWCDILLQWPREVAALGYVEWWLRHPAWCDLVMALSIPAFGASGAPSAYPMVSSGTVAVEQTPLLPHFLLLGHIMMTVTMENTLALFDALLDSFIHTVSEVLRGGGSTKLRPSAGSAGNTRPLGSPYLACETSGGRSENATRLKRGSVGSCAGQVVCGELLRLLTSLYADPPRILQPVLQLLRGGCSLVAQHDTYHRLDTTEKEGVGDETPASPSSPAGGAGDSVSNGGVQPKQRLASPAFPTDSSSSRGGGVAAATVPTVPSSTPSVVDAQWRPRVLKLHYQLLYAVCRLCNELPVNWERYECFQGEETEGYRARRSSAPVDSSMLSPFFAPDDQTLATFAAAVQLAGAIAALLLHVRLPMKGDLLCVTSRLAQGRETLLRSTCMSEREYANVMGHLSALMAQAI